MDPRLLRLYTDELTHLREMGGEFAREFPKVAGRLGLEGMEVADPYVERLLEGFAFLAARVQWQLDAEHPRLIAHLLEALYPNFLAPLPSMMVARLSVDVNDPALAAGLSVPRGSALVAEAARGQGTHCEFRTAHAMTLWPLELVSVRYAAVAPDLPPARVPQAGPVKGVLRLRLRLGGGLDWSQLPMDRLALHVAASDDVAFRLHELLGGAVAGTWVQPVPGTDAAVPEAATAWSGPGSVEPRGFDEDEALLPATSRGFSGHRLLQEVAVLPQRLLFVDLTDLRRRLARVSGAEAEVLVLFSRGDPALETLVDGGSLALFCTPAVNLFPKRLDRVPLEPGAWEHHVVPDRTRPMDLEVHQLLQVTGHGAGGRDAQREFLPLYAWHHGVEAGAGGGAAGGAAPGAAAADAAYYTLRRTPRVMSARQRQQGPRSAYLGEEVWISLVDGRHGAWQEELRQLSVQALVSNRDLPTLLPTAATGGGTWRLDAAGAVTRVETLRGPTRPVSRRPVGEAGWSLVRQLSLHHLALASEDPVRGAAVLRDTLALYAAPEDVAWARQIEGIRGLATRTVTGRLPFPGPLTFGTGLEMTLELDELAYPGSSAYLFASALERFLARHAAINTFTRLRLRTLQRGELRRWPARVGTQELL